MKITVTMDEEIARIIQQATEFYARVGCGQYWMIPHMISRVRDEHRDQLPFQDEVEAVRRADVALEAAKQAQFPELRLNQFHGHGFSRETDIAYNVYSAFRYAMMDPEKRNRIWDGPFEDIPHPEIVVDEECREK